jgi:hypothetical protein
MGGYYDGFSRNGMRKGGVDWIDLAHDRGMGRGLLKTMINLWVS